MRAIMAELQPYILRLYATIDAAREGGDKTCTGGAKVGFFEPQQKLDASFGSALAGHRVDYSLHKCGTGGLGCRNILAVPEKGRNDRVAGRLVSDDLGAFHAVDSLLGVDLPRHDAMLPSPSVSPSDR